MNISIEQVIKAKNLAKKYAKRQGLTHRQIKVVKLAICTSIRRGYSELEALLRAKQVVGFLAHS